MRKDAGQNEMSARPRRPDLGEMSSSMLKGSLFLSRLSNGCIELVERSRAAIVQWGEMGK
jgi:hypothetical protein